MNLSDQIQVKEPGAFGQPRWVPVTELIELVKAEMMKETDGRTQGERPVDNKEAAPFKGRPWIVLPCK